jgi:hypothetical protein
MARDDFLPVLAAAVRGRREAHTYADTGRPLSRQVLATQAGVATNTLRDFEEAKTWSNRTGAIVQALGETTGVSPLVIWQDALNGWRALREAAADLSESADRDVAGDADRSDADPGRVPTAPELLRDPERPAQTGSPERAVRSSDRGEASKPRRRGSS